MKLLLSILFLSSTALANVDIDACLKAWGKHPFGKGENYRTLKGRVKVIGIGSNIKDEEKTSGPALILVKPGVSVMAKQTYELLNPNGWYCLRSSVTVLGKSEISIHCKAKIAATHDGTAVAAASPEETGSVAVLGKVELKRVGCESGGN